MRCLLVALVGFAVGALPLSFLLTESEPFCLEHFLVTAEKVVVSFSWQRDPKLPDQNFRLSFLSEGELLLSTYQTSHEQHKYLYIHACEPKSVRTCASVSAGVAVAEISFTLSTTPDRFLPLKSDGERVASLLASASATLTGFEAQQAELDHQERVHFSRIDELDRKLERVTFLELSALLAGFALEISAVAWHLRRSYLL